MYCGMNAEAPDPRDIRIAELERENAELRARVAQLEVTLAELRARLGENSRNSSRPPSSDRGDARRQRRRKRSSGRSRGGQPGHGRATRQMLPPDQVTDVRPPRCRQCHAGLHGQDAAPRRYQRIDLPPIKPVVHEWRLHELECSKCGHKTRAAMPGELAQGSFGPRLTATVAALTGMYRLSKRNAQRFLHDLMGLELAVGTISKLECRTSRMLMAPVAQVAAAIRTSPVVNIDETSWVEDKQTTWLWSATTPELAYYHIARRTRAVAHQVLGEGFEGIVVSDRMASYADRSPDRRQVCWAHLDRTFEGILARGGPGARFGQAMKNLTTRMWQAWGALRDGQSTRSDFERRASRIAVKVRKVLHEFSALRIAKVTPLAQNLLAIEPALWTFVSRPDVEPTNNAAERALRPGVIHRKTSFGTDSPRGSHFISRMLSTVESLRRQSRRVFTSSSTFSPRTTIIRCPHFYPRKVRHWCERLHAHAPRRLDPFLTSGRAYPASSLAALRLHSRSREGL